MNRNFRLGTILLLVFGSLTTVALAIQYNWNDLQRGHRMIERGEFREARALCGAISRYGGDDGIRREACYFKGFCSIKMGDYWQALADYKGFLRNFDRMGNIRYVPDTLYVLGRTYETIGEQPSKAKDYYRQCIRRFPGNEFARKSRVQLESMELDMSIPSSVQAADTFCPPLGSSSANPYESLAVDRLQIHRINSLFKAIEAEKDVDKAVTTLSEGDRKLESVKNHLKILTQKAVFKQLHQDERINLKAIDPQESITIPQPNFDVNVKCGYCGGTGELKANSSYCPVCGGSGWAASPDNPQKCQRCGGTGWKGKGRCEGCGGTGWANGHGVAK